jgi:ABC-type phosphate transport system auxiliary subunit
MKQMVFYAVATLLLFGAGCKKKEDGTTELMSAEEVTGKAAEVTEKAEQVTQQTTAAVSAFTVKAEDVMGDLNQSVQHIKEKVAAFDKTQVLAYAQEYKTIILEKKDQVAGLSDKLKALSMTEMIGDKGKALKDQLAQYTDQLSGLKDRYSVYLDKLKEFGVDLTAYGL